MNSILKDIKDVTGEICVSIILNTHHTHPDSERDPLTLKNLQKEAVQKLLQHPNTQLAQSIIKRLDEVVSKIDHRHNTESLAIFVNENVAQYTRLPIAVNDRVVINNSFSTRDLVRSLHTQEAYYTLVLGQDRARLIEAANGRVIEEIGRPFPIVNYNLFTTTRKASSNATRVERYQKEFFNRVDKALWAVWREHPLPLIVAADEKNVAYFKTVSEHSDIIIGVYNDSFDKSAQHIVEANYHILEEYVRKKNEQRLSELRKASDAGNVLSDINDIWNAIQEGRGKTLFVQNGYYLPAEIADGIITPVSVEDANRPDVVDDIIDEMVEINTEYGGDTVFIFEGGLEKFNGLALTTRY